MDETINAFFEFYKYTEVSEVANLSIVLATYGVLSFDFHPGISLELLDTERHLAFVAVESKDYCFNIVTNLQEVLS